MHSNVAVKNVSWPHFSWPILYIQYILRNVEETRNIDCSAVRCEKYFDMVNLLGVCVSDSRV